MFSTVEEAIYYIEHIQRTNKRTNLNRMKKCAEILGNPQNQFKIIHIAGTNGKGSTACYIKSILMKKGYRVGFFVSPYIISFNERIQINDFYIENAKILEYTNKLKLLSEQIYNEDGEVITFFEMITLMGLLYFAEQGIEVAVIECGLGGLLDATNFVNADISVITNIGYDHMKTLGNTLSEIAANKLGIVKKNSVLFTAVEPPLHPQFQKYCALQNAKCYFTYSPMVHFKQNNTLDFEYDGICYKLPLLGKFQIQNAILALKVALCFDSTIDSKTIQAGFSAAIWPARMEVISTKPFVILDGGHNISAIEAVVDSLKEYRNKKIKIVYTALADKDYPSILKVLDLIASKYYFTTIEDSRGVDTSVFETKVEHSCFNDFRLAMDEAYKEYRENDLILIIGSLHFASAVRKFLLSKNPK